MDDPNIKCLFYCASAITGCDINSIEQFNDMELYYRIIDIKSDKCSSKDVIKIISGFFNDKLPPDFDDLAADDTLLKILLLTIVIYILKSNESNSKSSLTELCEKIPRDLHANACAMFAPIIMRYSDGDLITYNDLEKCLRDCDKENQMMFFSPIKTNDRPVLPDQRSHAIQKQKIHQSLKACRNYEQFTTFVDDFYQNETDEPSSFVKLVNYVQSPDYQTTKLMKCNRELGKNVNDLEYQLYMSSTFETELDKTINQWKDKCKSLENKLKQANHVLHSKEEEILEKNDQIEQFLNLVNVNKRLEDKMKDYQDKITEIQTLNAQFSVLVEENKKLKAENNSMHHYYSLAKQRRIELETMAKDFEYQKQLNSELTDTRERLSQTESQLAELQNYVQSIQNNQCHESISDASFNNSFYAPEQMSYVVEKERDELMGELTHLRETTIDKVSHETIVQEIEAKLRTLSQQLEELTNAQSDVVLFCQLTKEGKNWDGRVTGALESVKEVCDTFVRERIQLSECLEKLSQDCENMARICEDKEQLAARLSDEVIIVKRKLEDVEMECKGIVEDYDRETLVSVNDVISDIKQRLINDKLIIMGYKQEVASYHNAVDVIKNNLNGLKEELQCFKDFTRSFVNGIIGEITSFKDLLRDGNIVGRFANPWMESLFTFYQMSLTNKTSYKDISKKYDNVTEEIINLKLTNEEISMARGSLESKYKECIVNYEEKLMNIEKSLAMSHQVAINELRCSLEKDFENVRMDLVEKHYNEEMEMKLDMEKLIFDYQESLDQLNKLGQEHEDVVNTKNNDILIETRKGREANQRIKELEGELMEVNKSIDECRTNLTQKDSELWTNGMLLKQSKDACKGFEDEIKGLRDQIKELKLTEIVCTERVADLESMRQRFEEVKSFYNASESLVQRLTTEIDAQRQCNESDLLKCNCEIERKDSEILMLRSKLSTNIAEKEKLMSDNDRIVVDLQQLRMKETSCTMDLAIKDKKVKELGRDIENAVKTIDSLKFKLSKISLENDKMKTNIAEKDCELERLKKDIDNERVMTKFQICALDADLKEAQESLTDNLNKISSLEANLSAKGKKIEDLQNCVDSYNGQISSLSSLLMARNTEIEKLSMELEQKTSKISFLEKENSCDGVRISEMNVLIEELEEANRLKTVKLSDTYLETLSYKNAISGLELKNTELQGQLNDLANEVQLKDIDIVNSKASISDFSNKIHNLQSTIETEMENYDKINTVYKHMEQESMNYMKKYNDLVKENHEKCDEYEKRIKELINTIEKLEDERDDQIHDMEKTFNGKIFNLEQIVDESTLEIQSIKKENAESRKSQKLARLQLEGEVDRLQKALQSRESQFHDEKASLKMLLDIEREDKVKYKEGYEAEIDRLSNDMKCADEKYLLEVTEQKSTVSILEERVNELQVTNYRLSEEVKGKESQYKHEIKTLESRILELEPLEEKIKQLEEVTCRLHKKVSQLEDSDNVKELQQLRQNHKSIADYVGSLEQNIRELNNEKHKLEQEQMTLKDDCDELTTRNNDLKEKIETVMDKLDNSESRCKGRQKTIEHQEREIKTLTSDSESLKKRYLMLRDVNERHKSEVERDHEQAVSNYIARIESLTKDVAYCQDQIQSLTEHNNELVEKNYSSKRTIDEQSAKLNGLQKLVWSHTENERRQMLTTYDPNTRYTRMSHWAEKPQVMRQLPPVSCFDRQIVDSMGLNSSSRLRLESYLHSPYSMEDEPNIAITKEIPLPPALPPRRQSVTDSLSLVTVPMKKKKEGIRLQLTNKIRRSLNLDVVHSPKSHKPPPSESLKSDLSSTISYQKPPIPKKTFFSGSKSRSKNSQMNVIDISELRKKGSERDLVPKQECDDSQTTNVTPMSYDRRSSIAPASSIYSLFTQNDDQETKIELPEHDNIDVDSTNFTQSAKTPKTSSVIKRMIRRSKNNQSPKRKHNDTDNLQ